MAKKSERALGNKPTKLFLGYVCRLVFRLCLAAVVVYTFIKQPEKLRFTELFGIAGGLNLVDVVFVALLVDVATKFFPWARISMGSLKQYRDYHVPTAAMFEGGREGLLTFAKETISRGQEALRKGAENAKHIIEEIRNGSPESIRKTLRNIEILRLLPFSDRQLSSTKAVRKSIVKKRMREILPVLVFWVVLNVAVGLILDKFGVFNQGTVLLWTIFFYVWDMVCVVLWCPLQLVFMKNRCCTTCQIFNWDAMMTVTPLLTTVCLFSAVLVALSFIVIIRWEVSAVRYPERFDERTNASLSCGNCADKLCYLRHPLTVKFPDDVIVEPAKVLAPEKTA